MKVKRHPEELKQRVIAAAEINSVVDVAKTYKVSASRIYAWKAMAQKQNPLSAAPAAGSKAPKLREAIVLLKQVEDIFAKRPKRREDRGIQARVQLALEALEG